jgi:hypothetical protein
MPSPINADMPCPLPSPHHLLQEEFHGVGYNCSSGLGNGTISFMQALLPNTAVVQSRLFADELTRPSPGCVVSADAVLNYYEVGGGGEQGGGAWGGSSWTVLHACMCTADPCCMSVRLCNTACSG